MGLLGWKFTVLYVVIGMSVGILGGLFLDAIKAERWLQSFAAKALTKGQNNKQSSVSSVTNANKLFFKERHQFAKEESFEVLAAPGSGSLSVSALVPRYTVSSLMVGFKNI